jgi:transposase-like protein
MTGPARRVTPAGRHSYAKKRVPAVRVCSGVLAQRRGPAIAVASPFLDGQRKDTRVARTGSTTGGLTQRRARLSLRTLLPAEAVPYELSGRHLRISPRSLSYWIPFVAGLGVMVGGMKTAGVPFVGIPQLAVGILLIAVASWDFVSDSGRLDVAQAPPRHARRPVQDRGSTGPGQAATGTSRRTYTEAFRREAVEYVLATGKPIAVVAREMGVNPGTLGRWVKKDRAERGEGQPAA